MIRPAIATVRIVARLLARSAVVLMALSACQPDKPVQPPDLPGATSEPATAVRNLADFIRRNDWIGYAHAAVPESEYPQLQAAWTANLSRWPLDELPLHAQLLPLLQALSKPGAETMLKAEYDRQLANQNSDLRDAARSLGLFGTSYLQSQGDYDDTERQHYAAVIAALSKWGQKAPLGDPVRAHLAIERLCAAARATGITDDATLGTLGMEASLMKLAPFFTELKDVFAGGYGLELDASLEHLRSGLLRQNDNSATVQIEYPLADAQIQTTAILQRRDGHWYLAGTLAETDSILAKLAPPAPAGSVAASATTTMPATPATP